MFSMFAYATEEQMTRVCRINLQSTTWLWMWWMSINMTWQQGCQGCSCACVQAAAFLQCELFEVAAETQEACHFLSSFWRSFLLLRSAQEFHSDFPCSSAAFQAQGTRPTRRVFLSAETSLVAFCSITRPTLQWKAREWSGGAAGKQACKNVRVCWCVWEPGLCSTVKASSGDKAARWWQR